MENKKSFQNKKRDFTHSTRSKQFKPSNHTKPSSTKENASQRSTTQSSTTPVDDKIHFGLPYGIGQKKLKKKLNKIAKSLVPVKKVLSKRAKRMAKKLFKKNKQAPFGYKLTIHAFAPRANEKVTLPDHILHQHAMLEMKAVEIYKKSYERLTSNQQTRVFESMTDVESKAFKAAVN